MSLWADPSSGSETLLKKGGKILTAAVRSKMAVCPCVCVGVHACGHGAGEGAGPTGVCGHAAQVLGPGGPNQ